MDEQVKPTLPHRAIGISSAIALVLVIGLSALVGYVGGEDDFDWDLAAVFGTALGTTLLAMATGLLALLTWREVSATQELAALTRRDQRTRERPVVIQQDARFGGSAAAGHVLVQLINVGLGPALRVQVEASYIDPEHQPNITPTTVPAIVPGAVETARLPVSFQTMPPAGIRGDGFALSGTYLDRSQVTEYPIIADWHGGSSTPE